MFLPRRMSFLLVLVGLLAVGACDSSEDPEVTVEDLVVGSGAEAVVGDTLTVHYTGRLMNGTQFDSSYDRGAPTELFLYPGALIEGWVQGIPGMKVGGKRRLTIPPELGYGSRAWDSIPGNSTLVFEVELPCVQHTRYSEGAR